MRDNDSSPELREKPPLTEPAWITATLRLTPTPAFAIVAIAIFVFGSLMCFFLADAGQSEIGSAFCGLFAALACLIATASISRHLHRRRHDASDTRGQTNRERLPTGAIVAGFISVYSFLLTIGLHVFRNFFAANRPGGLKYNVTLGIALASSLYMAIHGRSVIRKHVGPREGRIAFISPGQALLVIALALSFGVYFAWIMG